jgi:hypothetical protein
MRPGLRLGLLAVLLAVHVGYAMATDTTSAFSDATSWGQSMNPGTRSMVNSATASTSVPRYGTGAPAEEALFGDAKSSVASPATVKVTDCATNPLDPDKYVRQECKAINWWQKNPGIRPTYSISRKADPLVTQVNTIKADPKTVIGTLPGIGGAYSGCTTTTRKVGSDQYLEESCTEARGVETSNCSKILTVDLNIQDTCTPGTWFPVGNVLSVDIHAYCDPGRLDFVRLKFTPLFTASPCRIPEIDFPTAPYAISSGQEFSTGYTCVSCGTDCTDCSVTYNNLLDHAVDSFGASCNIRWDIGYALGAQGCVSGTCTYSLTLLYEYKWFWGTLASAFAQPRKEVQEIDTWDNQCAPLEARLPDGGDTAPVIENP